MKVLILTIIFNMISVFSYGQEATGLDGVQGHVARALTLIAQYKGQEAGLMAVDFSDLFKEVNSIVESRDLLSQNPIGINIDTNKLKNLRRAVTQSCSSTLSNSFGIYANPVFSQNNCDRALENLGAPLFSLNQRLADIAKRASPYQLVSGH